MVKTKYSKMRLIRFICFIILIITGFAGHFHPVHAALSDNAAKTSPSKDVRPDKNETVSADRPADAKPEPEVATANQKKKDAIVEAPVTASEAWVQKVNFSQGPDENSKHPVPPKKADQSGQLVFNFDNAELSEVVRSLADLLNINYMLDKGVSGKVTIHTAGELSRKDLFPLFYQVLEINGITAVKEDNIYKIVPMKDAPRLPIVTRMAEDEQMPTGERVFIQIIPLKFVSAQEMGKILTPFISQDGTIVSQESANIIVLIDKSDNIAKALRLVKVFDTDIFERVNHRFYPLKYGDAESIVDIMDKLFLAYGNAVQADVSFIPITRLNTLLVVSSNPKAFDAVEDFLKQYDVPSQSTEPGIYVYPLKNGRAKDIAGILNNVFTGKKEQKEKQNADTAASAFRNPLGKQARQEKAVSQKKQKKVIPFAASSKGGDVAIGSGTLRGAIHITADESRNSLIIEAAPADYQIIKNLLTQLDIMPRQVIIEVTIAQIQLDESNAMGVEWSYAKGDANLSTSLLNATMGNSGLNFTIGNPDRWTAALSALATENKVDILSNPSILASNSMPAKIDISQEVPIASSQYQYTNDNNPLLETNIEYRDTGIMLSVTPNINEHGLVTMDIDQEISEQASNVSVGGQDYPSFFKRNATTTLTVQSGQTIVIGGLIRKTTSGGSSGTPWFTNLPILSFLFGKTSDSSSKTELIILISPYVIATPDDVDAVTREFTNKLSALRLKSE